MADYSDDEQQQQQQEKRLIDNQPYDELLEVPDGEDVASIYTPTPRHPKQQQQQQQQQNKQGRDDLPSSSVSSNSNEGSLKQRQFDHQRGKPTNSRVMSDSPSDRTPKDEDDDDHLNDDMIMQKNQLMQPPAGLGNQDQQSGSGGGGMQDDMEDEEEESDNVDGQDDDDESGDESADNDEIDVPGRYDASQFRDLPVEPDVKDIFKFIERYEPQTIELDFKLRPFIPDYIPSIGDIDAFIKVPRPDGKPDNLGFTVVDEPSSNQSDPHVLDLFFRTLSKQSNTNEASQASSNVKSVEGTNVKAIDSWVRNITALQKNKPVQSVNYQRAMPSIDSLMQVWPNEFEDLLKEISLPSPDLNVDLATYVDILCALTDIPVYKSRVQSIHLLFSLFSEFKNSEHFKNAGQGGNNRQIDPRNDNADKLVIE